MNNNPLRYTDPTGHMADYGGNEGGGGCNIITCFPQAPSNPPGGGGSGGGSNSGNSGNNGGTLTSTSTPCPQALSACLPTSTSTPVPTSTPILTNTPYGTPTPFGYDLVNNPNVQDFFYRSLPSLIPTDFGPDINAAWDSLLNGLPILGYPASSLSQAINSALTVGTYVVNSATNTAITVSNTIGTTVNNVSSALGNAMNTGFGGLGPILPIFYVPTNSPLSPPPVYN